MGLESIVAFWKQQREVDSKWIHPDDASVLFHSRWTHSFNLDFPAGPYIGDILGAPVVILGANAGYSPISTAEEFEPKGSKETYLAQIASPSKGWTQVSPYYRQKKYGQQLMAGHVAVVNACAYRSPEIGRNQTIIGHLPSIWNTRLWLWRDLLPLAAAGERLIVAWRYGLWVERNEERDALQALKGVVCTYPRSPDISD